MTTRISFLPWKPFFKEMVLRCKRLMTVKRDRPSSLRWNLTSLREVKQIKFKNGYWILDISILVVIFVHFWQKNCIGIFSLSCKNWIFSIEYWIFKEPLSIVDWRLNIYGIGSIFFSLHSVFLEEVRMPVNSSLYIFTNLRIEGLNENLIIKR